MSNATPSVDPTRTPPQGSLSPDLAFVVHFYAAEAGAGIEAGRAEHIRSGQTAHFGSWEELAAFVAATVGALRRS